MLTHTHTHIYIYIYIYIYTHTHTIDCSIQVDFLSLKNISTKLVINLYDRAKTKTFTTEWSTRRTVPLTINIHHSLVWIFETELDDFYYSGFSDYCLHLYCYIHNISASMSSGLLLILINITGYKCWVLLYCYLPAVMIEPATSRRFSIGSLRNQHLQLLRCVLQNKQPSWIK